LILTDPVTPTLRLTLPAEPENIAVIRHALAGVAAEAGASKELIDDIKTAASEAATNSVLHAYPSEGETGILEVAAELHDRFFEVSIRDFGIGIQPRPIESGQPSLRVGLALIGALSDSFEVRGRQGEGTEIRLGFDLDRERVAAEEPEELPATKDSTILFTKAEPGGAAIGRVMEMLAARANMNLDRFSDIQLVADLLAHWNNSATVDSQPLEIAIKDGVECLDIRIGPLEPGLGRRMLESGDLPGLGNALERVVDRVEITDVETVEGPAEILTLEIGASE
jgi:anti-sigma regulatory factor (Ser/Thr protein kinase)